MENYTEPIWKDSALVIIDVQNDTTIPSSPIHVPGTMEIIPNIEMLLQYFRKYNRPIIHVVRLYKPDGSNADICRREAIEGGEIFMAPHSWGAEMVEDLKPSPAIKNDAEALLSGRLQEIREREWIIYKPRWGAFYKTPLEEHLLSLGINTLVVCGCNFPNCPRATVLEASERDFRLVLIRDAVSGIYARGEEELQNVGVLLIDHGLCITHLREAFGD